MKQEPRNYRCKFYDQCLSLISLSGSKKSPCIGCPYENDRGGQRDLEADLPGCIALALVVMADRKSIRGFSSEKLLDQVFKRMTEMVGFIHGRRLKRRAFGFEKTPIETIVDE